MKRKNFPSRKESRRKFAEENHKKRDYLDQLEVLDKRLGKGKGAKKEREKLLRLFKKETIVDYDYKGILKDSGDSVF